MVNTETKSPGPLVTIITPSFNQGRFISQTIESVLGQSYRNIEYHIIDGGSTDDTLGILDSYGSRINYVSEKDNGQAHAINKGLRMANGNIIGFLNSDDYLLPGAVENVVDVFQSRKTKWVTGDYSIINENGIEIHSLIALYKRILRLFASKTLFELTNFIAQPSTFWHKELLTEVGLFDETLRFVMDYDYWLRLYSICPPTIIKKRLSCFRIHKSSKGGSEYVMQFDEEIDVLRKYNTRQILIAGHRFHNRLIKDVYRIIK